MLAKTVTKMFPTASTVGLHLKVTDDDRPDLGEGVQVVISEVIAEQFVKDEDITNEVRDEIGKRAQAFIDDYKALRVLYDKTVYGTKINQISGALTL